MGNAVVGRKSDVAAGVVLILDALIFGIFGAFYLIDPRAMAQKVGIVLGDVGSVIDVQGMYGGLELGLALFLAICAFQSQRRSLGLLAGTCALGGIALARVFAVIRFGSPGPEVAQLLAMDLFGAVVNGVTWAVHARSRRVFA
jgi:hypothetical protein